MKKALATIATTVIAGVLVWWLTEGIHPQKPIPQPPPPGPPRVLSFLERAAGAYTLSSWTPASRPLELGARVLEGSIQIDRNGVADWSVLLEQTYSPNPGKVRMTARGIVQLGAQQTQMVGVKGGQFNNNQYLDSKWGQVSEDVELAVRGWSSGQEDRFTISLDTQAGERQILQMMNSRGVFFWVK